MSRCAGCGLQLIGGCDCPDDQAVPTTWTGEWPGDAEVREGLAADLNDLAIKGGTGQLRWDGQRWQPLGSDEPGGAS